MGVGGEFGGADGIQIGGGLGPQAACLGCSY